MTRPPTWPLVITLLASPAASADPGSDGAAAGQAANLSAGASINQRSAASNVPGYTSTPPEAGYYGQPNLTGQANAALAACAGNATDPVCQAHTTALASANTSRPAVSAYDPSVTAASAIAANPTLTLGDLSVFYSGCSVSPSTTPAGTRQQTCHRYAGVGNYSCARNLDVSVSLSKSCTPGTWFAVGEVDRNSSDHMYAQAYCDPQRNDGLQAFKVFATGSQPSCIPWQSVTLPTDITTAPIFVANLSPNWNWSCWSPFAAVLKAGSGCTGVNCNYTFEFGRPVYGCPAGEVTGDQLTATTGLGWHQPLGGVDHCFATTQDTALGCPAGSALAYTRVGSAVCARSSGTASLQGASGWTLPLSFTKPGVAATETDTWDNQCPALATNGRCSVATPDVCVDGPSTKTIDGVPVSRPCWQYERTLTCANAAPTDDCAPLAAQGCTPASSTCQQMNPATGVCEITQATYQCPLAAQATTTVSNCPATQLCLSGTCFPTSAAADTDFAKAMSMLEAAREAGVYLDIAKLQVFGGEADNCRHRLIKNCCATNAAGAGMSNQSLFGVGSRLVFDVLMNASDRQFIAAGVKALLLGGGFSGSFTTYGVTVAVNGSAIPAGSVALTSTGDVVIAVDPWSLSVAIVLYTAMSLNSCNAEEGLLAMKEGASLCHTVGTYCSDSLPLIGCIEQTTGKCCFNSLLARLINEQGRAQLGKGWGGAASPDCSGFTIAQLQSLNFATMDLSAFYASLVPTLPSLGTIQTQTSAQVPNCYYGQGKCQ